MRPNLRGVKRAVSFKGLNPVGEIAEGMAYGELVSRESVCGKGKTTSGRKRGSSDEVK